VLADFLPVLGLLITTCLAMAGWFWKFSQDRPDSARKMLTKPGRYALVATIALALVSITSLSVQSFDKRTALKASQKREAELQAKLDRLSAPFDIARIEYLIRVSNSNPNIAAFIGAAPFTTTREHLKRSTPKEVSDKLLPILLLASGFSLHIFDGDTGDTPMNPGKTRLAYLVVSPLGGHTPHAEFDWWIKVHPPEAGKDNSTGWTTIAVTQSGNPVRSGLGSMPIASFMDLRGKTVFVQSSLQDSYLQRLILYSKSGVRYSLLEYGEGINDRPVPLGNSSIAKFNVPTRPPWNRN
jgi:hypothetical protein